MSTGFQPLVIDGKLAISSEDGFQQVKTIKMNIKQNLKMLLLTNPGERVMRPGFGVGIQKYLFEMSDNSVYAEIDSNIRQQVSIYFPFVKIKNVRFDSKDADSNKIKLTIIYSVPRISLNDVLTIDVL